MNEHDAKKLYDLLCSALEGLSLGEKMSLGTDWDKLPPKVQDKMGEVVTKYGPPAVTT